MMNDDLSCLSDLVGLTFVFDGNVKVCDAIEALGLITGVTSTSSGVEVAVKDKCTFRDAWRREENEIYGFILQHGAWYVVSSVYNRTVIDLRGGKDE